MATYECEETLTLETDAEGNTLVKEIVRNRA